MMSDIEQSIRKLSEAQRNVLDLIAIGAESGFHPRTLAKLEQLGLIESEQASQMTGLGLFTWTRYFMPIRVHIAWCSVCSSEFDALSPEEQAAMMGPDA